MLTPSGPSHPPLPAQGAASEASPLVLPLSSLPQGFIPTSFTPNTAHGALPSGTFMSGYQPQLDQPAEPPVIPDPGLLASDSEDDARSSGMSSPNTLTTPPALRQTLPRSRPASAASASPRAPSAFGNRSTTSNNRSYSRPASSRNSNRG